MSGKAEQVRAGQGMEGHSNHGSWAMRPIPAAFPAILLAWPVMPFLQTALADSSDRWEDGRLRARTHGDDTHRSLTQMTAPELLHRDTVKKTSKFCKGLHGPKVLSL